MKKLTYLLLMLGLIASCGKDTEIDTTPITPQVQMNGNIILINQFGDTLNDASGVNVYVEGELQSSSQENGNYTISGLKNNQTYNLEFSANHIGDLLYYNFVFVVGLGCFVII